MGGGCSVILKLVTVSVGFITEFVSDFITRDTMIMTVSKNEQLLKKLKKSRRSVYALIFSANYRTTMATTSHFFLRINPIKPAELSL